jgi:hypothetical protein
MAELTSGSLRSVEDGNTPIVELQDVGDVNNDDANQNTGQFSRAVSSAATSIIRGAADADVEPKPEKAQRDLLITKRWGASEILSTFGKSAMFSFLQRYGPQYGCDLEQFTEVVSVGKKIRAKAMADKCVRVRLAYDSQHGTGPVEPVTNQTTTAGQKRKSRDEDSESKRGPDQGETKGVKRCRIALRAIKRHALADAANLVKATHLNKLVNKADSLESPRYSVTTALFDKSNEPILGPDIQFRVQRVVKADDEMLKHPLKTGRRIRTKYEKTFHDEHHGLTLKIKLKLNSSDGYVQKLQQAKYLVNELFDMELGN